MQKAKHCFKVVASNGKDNNKREVLVLGDNVLDALTRLSQDDTSQYVLVHSITDLGICFY
jgi:hypothetical protein